MLIKVVREKIIEPLLNVESKYMCVWYSNLAVHENFHEDIQTLFNVANHCPQHVHVCQDNGINKECYQWVLLK